MSGIVRHFFLFAYSCGIQVDFMWINRDLLSFKWFLELLLEMDREKRIAGSVMDKFLDIRLYQTGSRTLSTDQCTHCTDPASDPASDISANPITSSGCSCTIRRMKHLLRFGRPVWDEVRNRSSYRFNNALTPMNNTFSPTRRYSVKFRREVPEKWWCFTVDLRPWLESSRRNANSSVSVLPKKSPNSKKKRLKY